MWIDKVEKLNGLEEFLAPDLSNKQAEALIFAYKERFFNILRKKGVKDILKQLDISDSGLSQRLSQGIKKPNKK